MNKYLISYLERLEIGYLEIYTPLNKKLCFGNINDDLKSTIYIKDWELLDLILAKGDIGLGKAYIDGLFSTDNIADFLLLISLNQKQLEPLFHSNFLYSFYFKIKNNFRHNSLKNSKKNIKYHYDLGNDFYQSWLDETMSYSSGIFQKGESLIMAQKNKYKKIISHLNKTDLPILEIGCGWGGFIKEVESLGYDVKGLTLSKEQKQFCDDFLKTNNFKSKIAFQDYRNEDGKYDNIISIEMFEAVGEKYWNDYFAKIKNSLNKNGKAIIQTITIDKKYFKKYKKTSDYIREYIFPGGMLPTEEIFKNIAKKHYLNIYETFNFGDSYQKTLLKWLENFKKSNSLILRQGFNIEFIRQWEFYLAYCAAGFASERTNVTQFYISND